MAKSKKGSKNSMKKRGKSTMRKKGGKTAKVGMRNLNIKWGGDGSKPNAGQYMPPPATRHLGMGRLAADKKIKNNPAFTPPERGQIFRKFNRLNGSANIRHGSQSAKQERWKTPNTLLGLEKGGGEGLVRDRRQMFLNALNQRKGDKASKLAKKIGQTYLKEKTNSNPKTFPQRSATSTIRSARRGAKASSSSTKSRQSNSNNPFSPNQNIGSWDFGAAMPLSSPPQDPCVVNKHEFTINGNFKRLSEFGLTHGFLPESNGIMIVTDVEPGSRSEASGIEVNDIIVAVNDTIVKGHVSIFKTIVKNGLHKLLVYRIR
jgi:hypothetical protein